VAGQSLVPSLAWLHGTDVGGANLKIIGNPYDEIRIDTQQDGSFVVTNVPAPVDWCVYSKIELIAVLGATQPVEFSTTPDHEEVNVGDIEIRPRHRLGRKVTLSDVSALADAMRITIGSGYAWGSQTVMIAGTAASSSSASRQGNTKSSPPLEVTACSRTRIRSTPPLTGQERSRDHSQSGCSPVAGGLHSAEVPEVSRTRRWEAADDTGTIGFSHSPCELLARFIRLIVFPKIALGGSETIWKKIELRSIVAMRQR
jgi:hypothetical protein